MSTLQDPAGAPPDPDAEAPGADLSVVAGRVVREVVAMPDGRRMTFYTRPSDDMDPP